MPAPRVDVSDCSAVAECPACGHREVALTASGALARHADHERADHADALARRAGAARARAARSAPTPARSGTSRADRPTVGPARLLGQR